MNVMKQHKTMAHDTDADLYPALITIACTCIRRIIGELKGREETLERALADIQANTQALEAKLVLMQDKCTHATQVAEQSHELGTCSKRPWSTVRSASCGP